MRRYSAAHDLAIFYQATPVVEHVATTLTKWFRDLEPCAGLSSRECRFVTTSQTTVQLC